MTDAVEAEKTPSDRELAAMFAPEPARDRLLAFYAWADEVEQVPIRAKEPAIQAMRFAWHREAVADLFASPQKVRRHDAYEGLARLVALETELAQAELVALIDAVEAGVSPEPIADRDALLEMIDAHAGGLMRVALRLAETAAEDSLITPAAHAAGLAQWVRQFAFRAGRQLPLVPETDFNAAGFNPHRLATGREPELAQQVFSGVLDALEAALADLKVAGAASAAAYPVLAPARLARATLKTARTSADLYRTDFSRPQISRQFDMIIGSLTGRL